MPLQENLNVSPYYADYTPLSDYYSILFKAGFPIQARELTNLQLMQQNQIEQFMSRFLKDGDTVVPGEYAYRISAYARMSSITQGATAQEFVGYQLRGTVSGVTATVYHATAETTTDDITFYINYESSGTTSEYTSFIEGETLESDTPNKYTAVVGVSGVSKPLAVYVLGELQECPAMGKGSLFTVEEGSYFVDGIAVRNDKQTIELEKYSTLPSYQVGFNVSEQFISSDEDPALLDNSQGSSNFAAPGADRLKITLTLAKTTSEAIKTDFIQICTLLQGNIVKEPTKQQNWNWLYDILAKRTMDESGDYIITDFPVELLQYWNTADVNGFFNADSDGLYPPIPGSGSTLDLTFQEADDNYVVKLSPGEAYVQGFNVGIERPVYLYGKKPRTQSFRANALVSITTPFDVKLTNVYNAPDFGNNTSSVNTVAFDGITMYRNFNDGYVGESVDANGDPSNAGQPPAKTFHVLTATDIDTANITEVSSVVYADGRGAVVRVGSDKIVARYDGTPETGSGDVINQIGGANVVVSIVMNPSPAGVINPRYLQPKNIIESRVAQGTNLEMAVASYDSTYDLGIVKSEFFSEFAIITDVGTTLETTPWSVGNIVRGERTGTLGTVEQGSTLDMLILSNVVGDFETGEYVTQVVSGGTKIGRIAREGEPLGFEFTGTEIYDMSTITSVTVTAQGTDTVLVPTTDFVHSAVTNKLLLTAAGRATLRNFPYPEGSSLQRNRVNLIANATDGSSTVTGYVVTIPSKTENSFSKTKSFFTALSDTPNFSADMAIENNLETDIFAIANRSLFSGTANTSQLTCNDFGGDPSQQLVFGDLITFTDNTGRQQSHLVYFATEPVGYGQNRVRSVVHLTTPLVNDVSSAVVSRIRIKPKGQPQNNLLFQLPQSTVASLQSDPDATGINYYVLQEFVVPASAGSTSLTLETNASNEQFIQGSADTIATVTDTDGGGGDEIGRQLTIYSSNVTDQGRKITLTFSEGSATPLRRNCTLKIILPVYVTNGKAKLKTKKTTTLVVTGDAATEFLISLDKADALAVTSMLMAPNNIDVRDNYLFDTGQRDNFYGISTLVLKEGSPPATGDLTITFDYYEHSGSGDFFTVDSYISDGGTNYADIPVYAPIAGIPISKSSVDLYIQLRDCVDFRPIVNTTGATPSYLPTVTPNKGAIGSTNFRNTSNDGNGVSPRIPVTGSNFQCNIAFYQAKIDSLFLEKSGALTLVEGATADEPIAPPDIATGIRLYDFKLSPYTFKIEAIKTDKFNYKSYKMKDIVALERRIGRLEELVSLSLLEQSALNMNVRDAVTGLDRFKNGMVVDNFSTHGQGATGSSYYRCSIDEIATHLRAPHYTDQIELIEKSQTLQLRTANGYRKAGPQLMLDYSEGIFTNQPFATRSVNLQPYTVFCYDGEVELDPAIDTWTDTSTQPSLVIRDNSLYDSMVNLTQEMTRAGMGTVWGDWQNTGRTRTDVNRTNTPQNAGRGPGTAENWNPAVEVTTTTQSVQQSRIQTRTDIRVQTGRTQTTSYGERITDVSLARTMRSRPTRVVASRLKPNTRYYIFFDDVDCTQWFASDNIVTGFPDGVNRYQSTPGTNSKGFGYPILSDDVGVIAGVFVIPNGRPPVAEQVYTNFANIQYETSGPTRSFNTGTRKFRITTSKTDSQDLEVVEGFAETTYVASGVLQDKQETVVATTIPSFSRSTSVTQTQNRWQPGATSVSARVIGPPPAPRIIERTEVRVVERTVERPIIQRVEVPVFWNDDDPIAQTFTIDENEYPDGMFLSEVGVFFETKDPRESVECYITTTDGEVPTDTILPYSIAVKQSDTTFRVKCELGVGVTSTTIPAGTTFTGGTTGSTAVLKSAVTFDAASQSSTKNVSNTTYVLIFDNYKGDFISGEILTPNTTPAQTSSFTIVEDEIDIDFAEVTDVGSNYSSAATVTFTAPQLPGGVTATGTVKVGSTGSSGAGMIYDIEITNAGSGYTKPPSATISDSAGSGATVAVRTSSGRKSVDMGVATSEDATAETRFRFLTPIYLLGATTYSFVLKAPTSLKYKAYTAKIGENQIGTQNRVTKVASLGSLFKSQNGGLWTADQTQDIKFNLSRAVFITDTVGRIDFINAPIEMRRAEDNPIRTSNNSLTEAGSTAFGSNPKVVQVSCMWHSLLPGDLVAIQGVTGNVGGIPDAELNTLHTVLDAGMNSFTIEVNTAATAKSRGGGTGVQLTSNKEYECINITTGAMTFGPTTLTATTTPTIGLSTSQAIRAKENTDSDSLELARNKYTREVAYDIELLETYYYSGVKSVVSEINEAKYNTSQRLNGQKSLEVSCFMITTDDAISPVVNLERTNANLIRNLVNYPDPADPIFGVPEATMIFNSDSSVLTNVTAGSTIEFRNNDNVLKTVYVDAHDTSTNRVKIRGQHVKDLKRSHTFTDANIHSLRDHIEVADGEFYYPEVNDRGSAWSKFITKLFIFENECDGIQLKLSACYYTKDSIRCYYRPRTVGFDGDISEVSWIPFNPEQDLVVTTVDADQQNALLEKRQKVPGLPDDVNLITVRDSDNVNPAEIGADGWKSLVWTAQDLAKFDALAIKIVMVVDNPALTPIIDDMQLVVTE